MSKRDKPKWLAWMADWQGTVVIAALVAFLWVGWQTAFVYILTAAFVLVLIWLFGR